MRNLFLYFGLQTEYADQIRKIYDKPVGQKSEEDIKFILKVFNECSSQVSKVRDEYLSKAVTTLEKLQDETDDPDMIDLLDFLIMLNEYLASREK